VAAGPETLSKFVRFALVGAIATGIQYAILIALVRNRITGPTLASCIGFVVSAGANYSLNYRFTFRSHNPHAGAIAKFLLLAGAGLLINAGLMRVLTAIGWNYILAQLCATGVVLLWNFFGNSLWTFSERAAA
jgi:putative flippase GtrA